MKILYTVINIAPRKCFIENIVHIHSNNKYTLFMYPYIAARNIINFVYIIFGNVLTHTKNDYKLS